MKKIFLTILFCLGALFLFGGKLEAQEQINLYFFYGDGCPHCAKEEIFLDQLEKDREDIKIYRFEVWYDFDNSQILAQLSKDLNIKQAGVPVLIISDQAIVGYGSDQTTGKKILQLLDKVEKEGCNDVVAPLIGLETESGECVHECDGGEECVHQCGCSDNNDITTTEITETVHVPFFGEINTKNVSLPFFTFVIAAADGFNPCAMWVLLFLISMLLGMQDKKRMWILGSTFIIASGAVYFLFLSAWLNLFLFLGFVIWVRIAIGLTALVGGGLHLRTAWRNRDGCEVTDDARRQKIFAKLRSLTQEKKFWIALGGIILLAFAVNLVELMCSAGLPAVYTQVLALAQIPTWQYYSYLIFYILIFMLDDLFVFFIAMTTLQMKAISSRYTKWAGWVGGVLMILIGLLLLFKPGLLMFG